MTVAASAPGKLILMGEHAAVYGRPALVAAAGFRARAEVGTGAEAGVELELPDLGLAERDAWPDLLEYARRARQAWEAYREDPENVAFSTVRGEDPAHLVKVVLGEVAEHLALSGPDPLRLRVESEVPVGCGLGSSAAVAVSLTAALLAHWGHEPRASRVAALALEAERRQHGLPSGIDHSTVLEGGVVWAVRGGSGSLEVEAVRVRSPLLRRMRLFSTGSPAESTGEVVAAVRRRVGGAPRRYGKILDRMEEAVRRFRRALESPEERSREIGTLVRGYESCLESLGVVPPTVAARIRQLEARGWTAKISGAGALSGDRAGSLLAYPVAEGATPEEVTGPGIEALPVDLGAEGLRLEVA